MPDLEIGVLRLGDLGFLWGLPDKSVPVVGVGFTARVAFA